MPPRALVVDDSRATRAMLRRILAQLGYDEAAEAGDGQQGLARLEANGGVELVLVDWNMPVMDGYEFIRAVRADTKWDAVKLVMVTTESEPTHVQQALAAGADEYVMKPFSADVLREKLGLLGLERLS